MAEYNRNFTDELRERLSIVDIVGRRVPLSKKGSNYWGCCPFHNEKTPSFSVNEEKGFYHCFGCGEHGDIISFTMKSGNMDFKSAIGELAQMAGLKLPDYKPKSPEQMAREQSYTEITKMAAKLYQEKLFAHGGEFALEYAKSRGFSIDIIKKYGIGFAPNSNTISSKFSNIKSENLIATGLVRTGDYGSYDFFRNKLMFPIFNASGQIVAFSGRSLDGSEPKYVNTSDTELFHKRKTIFGLNFARDAIHRNNRSIVVEGQIDAIKMQTNGFPETVAPLGTAITEDHLALLCKSNRNIVFCFDGDNAGVKAAARACDIIMPMIRDNSDIKFAFMPNKSDPDDVLKSGGEIAMRKIIDNASILVDFLWDLANKSFNIKTPNGKSQAEKFLKKHTDKIIEFSLRAEFEKEYNNRKFNEWHKWGKSKNNSVDAVVPDVDKITSNTLNAIIEKYPDLAERHADFLMTQNISGDSSTEMTFSDAEKFIISLKLKKYIERLNSERKDLLNQIFNGNESLKPDIEKIDSEIKKSKDRLKLIGETI